MSGGSGNGNGFHKALHFDVAPARVVSLVPSITESLFDLGVGEVVVGITDYCTQPGEKLKSLPRLGGPKNPRVEDILALKPDLVIANWEENTRGPVEALEAAEIPVWVTFPHTVSGTLEMLYTLARLFRSQAAQVRVQTLELTVEWAIRAVAGRTPVRYFCPIWQETTSDGQPWWMTFNQNTYCNDILELVGGQNVFAGRERRYPLAADLGLQAADEPGERDIRYPRVTLEEILQAQPELILLPDEPYAYHEDDKARLMEVLDGTPAAQKNCIHTLDGSLVTWPGTRMARALQELPALFDSCLS